MIYNTNVGTRGGRRKEEEEEEEGCKVIRCNTKKIGIIILL